MKLKHYEIPPYGPDDGLRQEDLEQYRLKNFDLKAYQLAEQQWDSDPTPGRYAPPLLEPGTDSPRPVAGAREAPSPTELAPNPWSSTREEPDAQSLTHAPSPVQTELNQLAPGPCDVQFGAHFNLQTVSYSPLSSAQAWKVPRWVVATVGLFFGSAAVLTIAFCVVLLRDAKPAEQPALPPLATTSAVPAQPASAPDPRATIERAAVERAAVPQPSGPAAANLMRDDPVLRHRIVVSRHPGVVRRHVYRSRRLVSKSTSSSVAAQETETASRPPPKDALDQLLSESSF